MIELRQQEHDALAALRRAGGDGLPLSAVGLSVAARLSLFELATITVADPATGSLQRAVITAQGRAFHLRSAT